MIAECQETNALLDRILAFTKNSLESSAQENLIQKVQLADLDSQLMNYRKSIELLIDYFRKGRSEPLAKFTKVLQEPQLKSTLSELLKK